MLRYRKPRWPVLEQPAIMMNAATGRVVGQVGFNQEFPIQWGSEIQNSMDFEWLKRGWVANFPDFKWDLK